MATVKGLQLQFSSDELIEHCKRREVYHSALSKKYSDKVAEALKRKAVAVETMHQVTVTQDVTALEEEPLELELDFKGVYSRTANTAAEDTREDEVKADKHRKRLKYFRIFGGHIIKGRVYRLNSADLNTLEMV